MVTLAPHFGHRGGAHALERGVTYGPDHSPRRGHLPQSAAPLNTFRTAFNEERPHEALGQQPPAALYHASPRPLPARLPPLEYRAHFEIRRVSRNGGIRWQHRWVNVSHVLGDQHVGLEEIADGE